MAQATLFDPVTGQRKVVAVGGQDAQKYFGLGYKLETPTQNFQTYKSPSREILKGEGDRLYSFDSSTGQSQYIPDQRTLADLVVKGGYQDTRRNLADVISPPTAPSSMYATQDLSRQRDLSFGTQQAQPQIQGGSDALSTMMMILKGAQQPDTTDDSDLLAQRNALVQARFTSLGQPTPEQMQVLSPDQQAAIRSMEAKGLETQLGGINTALEARERRKEEIRKDYQTYAKKFEPIEINGQLVQLNPQTGKYEAVFEELKDKGYQSGIIGEYQFYVDQEKAAGRTPKSFTQYQDEDSNRKRLASQIVGSSGMTPVQTSQFYTLVDRYNKSPLIVASERTIVLKNAIDQVNADPNNGTLQLNLVYSYIQALDTYQSAVREGELGLVNSIDSKIGKLSNAVEQIQNGQIVRADVAKQIADASKVLVDTINQGAKNVENKFTATANVGGIESAWQQFRGGFISSYDQQNNQQNLSLENYAEQKGYSAAEVQGLLNRGRTPEQIRQLIDQGSNFNNESQTSLKGAMRTDRHNNPTAFTTDIAKLAGLREGQDYVVGDPFDNGKYRTAKILGDPIDKTINVIDRIGFQTASGKSRWSYINMSKHQWDGLSYQQKKNVIGEMYKQEGGTKLMKYFI